MREYFKINQVTEGVYQIYEPGGVGSSLIIGKRQAMLIDTGYGFADISKAVRTVTDLPLRVVNTHGHTDHTGGNRYFNKVWMNPADKATYKEYQNHQKPLVAARFESVRKAAGKGPIWPEDFDRMAWYAAGTKEFCWLINGQTFDLDAPEERCNQTFDFEEASEENHLIEAIFIPGHTVGSVMFFDWKITFCFREMIWITVSGCILRQVRLCILTKNGYSSWNNIRLRQFCRLTENSSYPRGSLNGCRRLLSTCLWKKAVGFSIRERESLDTCIRRL